MSDSRAILVAQRPKPRFDVAGALTRASRETGRSAVKVGMDMICRMCGAQRLRPDEYFVQGAWVGDTTARAAFVGSSSNFRLNRSLIAKGADDQTQLMADKFLSGLVLQANGFPVPELKAVFAAARMFGPTRTLISAEELAGWMGEPGQLPAFAKPVDGTMALGSIPLAAAGPGQVDIGSRVVERVALAGEVARLYPRGWLIQEQLRQPVEIEALIGPGIGTVRVVTLWEAGGPQVLYAVWRHPAPGTWVDAAIFGKPNVGCALDAEGVVTDAQMGDLFTGRAVTHSLVNPELPLVGYQLPHWPEIVEICRSAHRLFPGHALIGWDIAITGRGPVISEVNSNPLHMSYQRAYRRGFLHAEHRARLDEARRLLQKRCTGSKG
ncbi:sugar-transfer associated ATP-grasp domain-containing protein [Rhodobacter sp. SY28-1]|uniref:sugar-transfer associated ATP-grasp domain-containing protein n=1 Tax=Rhodobacter sp. SY28-1 TaxID=2562317 RepID=UPI0010BFE881|nr:sugar-transfer associated ATP-grasp domain-containing protein [Rhodobacter sp. SY28-1]